MGNRKHRYQQRSYKYQEQDRVPEYFEEYDDYDDYYDYYDGYNCWDCSTCCWGTEQSDPSVDSAPSFDEDDDSGTITKTTTDQVRGNSLFTPLLVEVKNRYAILDEDDEKQVTSPSCEEDTSNDQPKEEDKIEWSVYHGKTAKRRIRLFKKAVTVASLRKLIIQRWIDSSWFQQHADEDGIWIVSVEGLFREKRKAGYGVIIRDRHGVPLVASSGVYDHGEPVSELYHELQGFNRGLELAIKFGLRKLHLFCTIYDAFDVVRRACSFAGIAGVLRTFGCYCQDKHRNIALNIVCKSCIDSTCYLQYDGGIELLYPLIQEIVHKCSMFADSPKFKYTSTRKRYNVAADYLAKLQVKQEEMKPDEFPDELKDILYEDAHSPKMMYSKLSHW